MEWNRGVWAHGVGWSPRKALRLEGQTWVCVQQPNKGRHIWWSFSHWLSCLLIRWPLATMSRCLPPGQRSKAGVLFLGLGKDTHTSLRAGSSSKTPGCRLEKMFPDMFLQGAGNSKTDLRVSWHQRGEGEGRACRDLEASGAAFLLPNPLLG